MSVRTSIATLCAAVVALSGLLACSPAAEPPSPEAFNRPRPTPGDGGDTSYTGAGLRDGFETVEGWAQSPVLGASGAVGRGSFLVGLWEDVGDAPIAIEVRGVLPDGGTTPWVAAVVAWREAPYAVGWADLPQQVQATQIRIPVEQVPWVESLTYGAANPSDEEGAGADDSSGIGTSQQALSSDLASFVRPRSAWGAKPAKCKSDPKKWRMAIHHTFNAPGTPATYPKLIRGFQEYHMSKGWCDIGYHFLVSEDGTIWEGCALETRGTHVANNNTGNIGISWIGCYEPGGCNSITSQQTPPPAALAAGAKIIAKLADTFGIAINGTNIKGHQFHSGANTDCPGENMVKRVPDMLDAAKNQGAPPPNQPPPPPPPPSSGRALGVVWDLSTSSTPNGLGNKRITTATVSVDGGPAISVKAPDAYWEFTLPAGKHSVEANAPGYLSAKNTVDVQDGKDEWASVGLVPSGGTSSYGTFETSWTCGGTAGTKKNAAGKYYTTTFGCWVDGNGVSHQDSGDNCIPWCLSGAAGQGRKAQYDALCGGLSGPACERKVNWYTADAGRFGCAARLRVKNTKNGKSAVLAVLDLGPACWVESKVSHWVLDMSYPASNYLFGGPTSVTEKAAVQVEEVPITTPLGPGN